MIWTVREFLAASALAVLLAGGPATADEAASPAAGTPALPRSAPMGYTECVREIAAVAGRLGQTAEIVEDQPGLRVVRFTTAEGRVVIGCSAADARMVVATGG